MATVCRRLLSESLQEWLDGVLERRLNLQTYLLPALVGLGLLLLFVQFPPTGDDWILLGKEYGIREHLLRVRHDWVNQNGRVLGNFLHTLLVHHWPGILSKLLAFFGMVYALSRIAKRSVWAIAPVLSATLLFLPKEVLREVWVWNAGFFNYVPPLVLLLVLLLLWQVEELSERRKAAIVVTSLCACLFMENITVYLLLIGFVLLLWALFRASDYRLRALLTFAGCAAGALIMFSSPSYRRVVDATDGYRSAGTDLASMVHTAIVNWNESFSRYLIAENLFLLSLILLSASALLMVQKERTWALKISLILLWISGPSLWLIARLTDGPISVRHSFPLHLVFYLSLLGFGWLTLRGRDRHLYAFVLISLAVVMGPLLIVTPVGARNFFTPVVFQLLAVLLLWRGLPELPAASRLVLLAAVLVFSLVRWGQLLFIYSENFSVHRERMAIAEAAASRSDAEVTVPAFPYPSYLHATDPGKIGHAYYRQEPMDMLILEEE